MNKPTTQQIRSQFGTKLHLSEIQEVAAWYDIIRRAGVSHRQLTVMEIARMIRSAKCHDNRPD